MGQVLEHLQKLGPNDVVQSGQGYGNVLRIRSGFSNNGLVPAKAVKQFELQGSDWLFLTKASQSFFAMFVNIQSDEFGEWSYCGFSKLLEVGNSFEFGFKVPNNWHFYVPIEFDLAKVSKEKISKPKDGFPGLYSYRILELTP